MREVERVANPAIDRVLQPTHPLDDLRERATRPVSERFSRADDRTHEAVLYACVGTQIGRPAADDSGPKEDTVPLRPEAGGGKLPFGERVGRYLVLDVLGRGGMGVVYAAYDPVLDRKIAVKVLSYVDDGDGRARMQREAQALARLTHTNVITVHDVAEHEGATYIAMEIVEGGTLRDWCAGRSWRDVVTGYVAAARGLAAAHTAGLVHRDFKPDNVLVGKDGRIRVTDFGLARAVGDLARPIEPGMSPTSPLSDKLTVEGAVMGTPSYMAPEQIDGGTVDARSDQFAWCVALWEALYDVQPFPSTGNLALRAAAIQTDKPVVPQHKVVPPSVGRALVRGMAAEPKDRWPDLNALLDELERADARAVPHRPRRRRRGARRGRADRGVRARSHVVGTGRRADLRGTAGASAATLVDARAEEQGRGRRSRRSRRAVRRPTPSPPLDAKLVAWRARWQRTAVASCEASTIGMQSAAMLDLRGGCLARRRAELDNLMDVLATPTRAVVEHAPSLTLPDLDPCDAAAELAGVAPQPRDPRIATLAARLDALERDLLRGLPLDLARALVTPARLGRDRRDRDRLAAAGRARPQGRRRDRARARRQARAWHADVGRGRGVGGQ